MPEIVCLTNSRQVLRVGLPNNLPHYVLYQTVDRILEAHYLQERRFSYTPPSVAGYSSYRDVHKNILSNNNRRKFSVQNQISPPVHSKQAAMKRRVTLPERSQPFKTDSGAISFQRKQGMQPSLCVEPSARRTEASNGQPFLPCKENQSRLVEEVKEHESSNPENIWIAPFSGSQSVINNSAGSVSRERKWGVSERIVVRQEANKEDDTSSALDSGVFSEICEPESRGETTKMGNLKNIFFQKLLKIKM
eukprot:TRINITY_DN3795_c0_g1_i4.p1 TRINITY_DN3795_c0_g1~~TRINITY_DN3795_c0_g1_i4.p1  ORF type:complete len:249 (-),score=22.21 TRINITY_DN3795_c0_g1_i4:21-767(-)